MAPRSDSETDWQLECGEIKQRGARLLKTGQWSDCTFLVGPGPDQVHFKAHKLILAMASPVFEAMFYGSMCEGSDPIPIPDMSPDAFNKFLVYVYTDNIELDSCTSARDLYYGAQKYMLPHLMKVCITYLSCNLTPKTVGRTYEFAELVGDKVLIEESLQLIRWQTKAVLKHRSFTKLAIGTVLKVFQMSPLNIDSELDLFAAAEQYAKALDKRNGDDQEEADDVDDLQNGTTKNRYRNFLAKMKKLAGNERESKKIRCRELFEELVDARVDPDEFCTTLEQQLNASSSTTITGSTKKGLPSLRKYIAAQKRMIEGIVDPAIDMASTISVPVHPVVPNVETQPPRVVHPPTPRAVQPLAPRAVQILAPHAVRPLASRAVQLPDPRCVLLPNPRAVNRPAPRAVNPPAIRAVHPPAPHAVHSPAPLAVHTPASHAFQPPLPLSTPAPGHSAHVTTPPETAHTPSVNVNSVTSQKSNEVSDMDVENSNEVKASGSGENEKMTKETNNKQLKIGTRNFANEEWAPLIRNLLNQIRFLTLTVKQLAEYKTLSSLLTDSEIMALVMNIASSETHIPMPSGFSTCRESRNQPSQFAVHDNNVSVNTNARTGGTEKRFKRRHE